jgi:hypothetical protein
MNYQVLEPDEPQPIVLPPSATSLDYLQAIYRDPRQPETRRIRCAIAALPFEHPKLAVTAVVASDGFGAKLEAARQRSAKVIEGRAEPRALPTPTPMDAPMARLRRF